MIVSIPSRGFWFFEAGSKMPCLRILAIKVSIPSRGFWFFEGIIRAAIAAYDNQTCFNPLAGILVF